MLKKFYKFHLFKDKIKQLLLLPANKLYIAKNYNNNLVSLNETCKEKTYTIFWAIDAGLTYHFISHCILAKTLMTMNHDVFLVRCHRHLKRCTIMDALDIQPNANKITKEWVCSQCTRNSIDFGREYGLPTIDLSALIPGNKLHDVLNQLNLTADVKNFTYDDINFGKIAIGEVFRTRKLYNMDLSSEEVSHAKEHIAGSITNYLAFENLKNKINIGRVVYFGDYCNVLGIVASAKKSSIPISNISHALINNIQRGKIIFGQALSTRDQFDKLCKWEKLKNYSLQHDDVKKIGDDLLNRISKGGFTIYSPLKSTNSNKLYSQLNLDPNKKLLVAFTSSLDEAEATNLQYAGLNEPPLPMDNPFNDQIEWIHQLIEFTQKNIDVQLVVRIHPREGTDGNQKKISKHLLQLQANFSNAYERVVFVWPKDITSSYDLAELADLILISWTSVGLEMARFGAPVLAAFQYCPYPKPDVVLWASNKDKYFEIVRSNLLTPVSSIDRIKYAFRWFNLVRLGSTIDISDINPDSNFAALPEFKMPKKYKEIESILIHHKNVLDINYNNSTNDAAFELEAIQAFLKKAVWYLFTGKLIDDKLKLLFVPENYAYNIDDFDAVIQYNNHNYVKFFNKNQIVEKKSPLIARIARLLN